VEEVVPVTFGEIVHRRRLELGISQETVTKLGGPSASSLRAIENGNHFAEFRPVSLNRLDRALGWEFGTAAKLAAGQVFEPVLRDQGKTVSYSVEALINLVPRATLAELHRLRDSVNTAIAIRTEQS
jgi:transcriptional regulator with XRE-family HTH domain